IEETLTEEQTEFANEFMNVETSATPVREYDELVRYFDYTIDNEKKT
ncbi:unnamed protein product, partial [Rotaria socialis]